MTTPPRAPAVAVRGDVEQDMVDYARDKLDDAVAHLPDAVLATEVHLDHHTDPARRPAYHVEMVADVNGNVVRARQSAHSLTEAIDGAAARLRRRVTRAHDRLRALHLRHRDEASWHHDDAAAAPPPFFPRPGDERTVVRRKSFATSPESIEEAFADLEDLEHDFLLFVHDATNAEAIAYRVEGGYGLMQREPTPAAVAALGTPLELGPSPATTTLDDALNTLEASGAPFEFFIDALTGDAMVAYHRFDGHFGLIFAG